MSPTPLVSPLLVVSPVSPEPSVLLVSPPDVPSTPGVHGIPCAPTTPLQGTGCHCPQCPPVPAAIRSRLAMVQHGMGSFLVFVGLRGSAAELDLPATNFWIYPHNDLDTM